MTSSWNDLLQADTIPALFSGADEALAFFVQRDLLEADPGPVEALWEIDEVGLLIRKQHPDGSWRYPGKSIDPVTGTQYDLLETFRQLRVLTAQYGFHKGHPALEKAAEYVFTYQTEEGDLRGIIGNQYMPYYHGALLELLISAGYGDDPRVIRGLDWLLEMRQDDGGWIVPVQAVAPKERGEGFWLGEPVPPARARPFSHLATGMALRAFTAHNDYRGREEIHQAARCLKSRFFKPDRYNDRKGPPYWLKFQYPFWWTNLLTALDSLAWLGFTDQDADVQRGLDWFIENQSPDGLWDTGYGSGRPAFLARRWVALAICRVLKRLL